MNSHDPPQSMTGLVLSLIDLFSRVGQSKRCTPGPRACAPAFTHLEEPNRSLVLGTECGWAIGTWEEDERR